MASTGQEQIKPVVRKRPARQTRLVESFKTPQLEIVLDPPGKLDNLLQDISLSVRLGGVEVRGKNLSDIIIIHGVSMWVG